MDDSSWTLSRLSTYAQGNHSRRDAFELSRRLVLINDARPPEWSGTSNALDCAEWLGLAPYAPGMVSWDVFDAVLTPGDLILMRVFEDRLSVDHFGDIAIQKKNARLPQVRIIRDYGMFDRREAP